MVSFTKDSGALEMEPQKCRTPDQGAGLSRSPPLVGVPCAIADVHQVPREARAHGRGGEGSHRTRSALHPFAVSGICQDHPPPPKKASGKAASSLRGPGALNVGEAGVHSAPAEPTAPKSPPAFPQSPPHTDAGKCFKSKMRGSAVTADGVLSQDSPQEPSSRSQPQ